MASLHAPASLLQLLAPTRQDAHPTAPSLSPAQLCDPRVPRDRHPDRRAAGHVLDPRQPGAWGGARHGAAPAGGGGAQEGRQGGCAGSGTSCALLAWLRLTRALCAVAVNQCAVAVNQPTNAPPSAPPRPCRPAPTASPPSAAPWTAATRACRSCVPTPKPSSRASSLTASGGWLGGWVLVRCAHLCAHLPPRLLAFNDLDLDLDLLHVLAPSAPPCAPVGTAPRRSVPPSSRASAPGRACTPPPSSPTSTSRWVPACTADPAGL